MEARNVAQQTSRTRSAGAEIEALWLSLVVDHQPVHRHDCGAAVPPLGLDSDPGHCFVTQGSSTSPRTEAVSQGSTVFHFRDSIFTAGELSPTTWELSTGTYKDEDASPPAPDHVLPEHSTSSPSFNPNTPAVPTMEYSPFSDFQNYLGSGEALNVDSVDPLLFGPTDDPQQYGDSHSTMGHCCYDDQFSLPWLPAFQPSSDDDSFHSTHVIKAESEAPHVMPIPEQAFAQSPLVPQPRPVQATPRNDGYGEAEPTSDSWASLLYKCLLEAPGYNMSLPDIYEWMRTNSQKIQQESKRGWENSVRHNLSMNKGFEKMPPPVGRHQSKKTTHWRLSREALHRGHVLSTTRYRKSTARGATRQRTASPAAPGRDLTRIRGRRAAARGATAHLEAERDDTVEAPTSAPRATSETRSAPDAFPNSHDSYMAEWLSSEEEATPITTPLDGYVSGMPWGFNMDNMMGSTVGGTRYELLFPYDGVDTMTMTQPECINWADAYSNATQ